VVSRAVTAGEVLLREDAFSLVYCDTNDDNNLDLALAAKLLSTGHDSHPTFASLHTNIESLSSEDKADLARDSKIVLKLLDASFSSLGPTLPIRAMNTLARVRINALTVVNCCDGKRSGLGMYCAAAMMNHDCDPSAGVWFDRENESLLVVRALRPLEPGEEVTIAYIERSFPHLKRQSLLSRSFQFDCKCGRCIKESSHEPEMQIVFDAEAAKLCSRGVMAYCSGDSEEALELMHLAEEALSESHVHTTSNSEASETASELRRRIWRFKANAAVAQREFAVAEPALAALAASNAVLFPYHRHDDALSASSPHLDSAMTEADLAQVRLAIIEEEEREEMQKLPSVRSVNLNHLIQRRREAAELLQYAINAVELMYGSGSGLLSEAAR
jgi:hypothetical protein